MTEKAPENLQIDAEKQDAVPESDNTFEKVKKKITRKIN